MEKNETRNNQSISKRTNTHKRRPKTERNDKAKARPSAERGNKPKSGFPTEKSAKPRYGVPMERNDRLRSRFCAERSDKPRSGFPGFSAERNDKARARPSSERNNKAKDRPLVERGEKIKGKSTRSITERHDAPRDPSTRSFTERDKTRNSHPAMEKSEKAKGRSHCGWMWGVHAVEAALKMGRHVYELYYLPQKAEHFQGFGGRSVSVQQLEKYVPKGVVHQGVVLCAGPAPTATLDTLFPEKGTVLILDQIVDPHNLGALWRSAAAFGVQAVVIPEDRSSPLCGVVAKAASGALEYVPCVRVTNLARALEQLKKQGFFVVGLDESGQELNPRVAFLDIGVALVVGSEDKGMRPLTQNHCDVVWKLSVSPQFSTLNASVAGAVALSQVYAK